MALVALLAAHDDRGASVTLAVTRVPADQTPSQALTDTVINLLAQEARWPDIKRAGRSFVEDERN